MKKMLSERYLNTDIVCDIVLAVGVVPEVVAVLNNNCQKMVDTTKVWKVKRS